MAAPSPRAPSCETCVSSVGRTSPSSARRSTAARPIAPGARFGPQAMRAISALDSGYNFELGVDVWESLDMVDVGDVSVIPANIEKTFDQIDKAVAYIHERAVFPVVLGGDHSIGYPDIRGIASRISTGTSASSTSTAISICPSTTTTSGCTARRSSTPRTSPTPRPPTWCRSASAAGRAIAPERAVARDAEHDRHHHDRHRSLGGRADV